MTQAKHQPSRLLFFRPAPTQQDPRVAAARERAALYRQGGKPLPDPEEPEVDRTQEPATLEAWGDLASQRIEEAMRRGEFDNLSSQGKPLSVGRDPFVPEEKQMAYRLLKNNDMAPEWIADRKETLAAVERLRLTLRAVAGEALTQFRATEDAGRQAEVQRQWERWLARWSEEVVELNRRIQTLNLKQPIAHLEVFKVRLDEELRAAGVGHTLG